jgi:hypothetical protein
MSTEVKYGKAAKRPNPPMSLANCGSDIEIIHAALDRLVRFGRPLLSTDIHDPQTRMIYFMMRAKAHAKDVIARAAS